MGRSGEGSQRQRSRSDVGDSRGRAQRAAAAREASSGAAAEESAGNESASGRSLPRTRTRRSASPRTAVSHHTEEAAEGEQRHDDDNQAESTAANPSTEEQTTSAVTSPQQAIASLAPSTSSLSLISGPGRPGPSTRSRESNIRTSVPSPSPSQHVLSSSSRRRSSRGAGSTGSRSPSLSPRLAGASSPRRSRRQAGGRFANLPPSPSLPQGGFAGSSTVGTVGAGATSGGSTEQRAVSTPLPPPMSSSRLPSSSSARLEVPAATLPPPVAAGVTSRSPLPSFPVPAARDENVYSLQVAQEPTTGSAFGTNILSRLPINPPLVLELHVTDRSGREISIPEEMPFLVCQVSIITEDNLPADVLAPVSNPVSTSGEASSSSSPTTPAAPRQPPSPVRTLYGTLAASPQEFSSPSGFPKTYFLFPEISVRARGRFRLRATLLRIPNAITGFVPTTSPLAQVTTNVFEVLVSSEYIAPEPTEFTIHLQKQGANVFAGQRPPQQD